MDLTKNRLDKALQKSSDIIDSDNDNHKNENDENLGSSVSNFYGNSPMSSSSFTGTWPSSSSFERYAERIGNTWPSSFETTSRQPLKTYSRNTNSVSKFNFRGPRRSLFPSPNKAKDDKENVFASPKKSPYFQKYRPSYKIGFPNAGNFFCRLYCT